jgi:hypothetical protein
MFFLRELDEANHFGIIGEFFPAVIPGLRFARPVRGLSLETPLRGSSG